MSKDNIVIEVYAPRFRQVFFNMNITWLEKYFTVEPIHRKILANPEQHILSDGGEIFFALQNEEVIGTVAVKVEDDNTYELTKLAVTDAAQGKGVGKLLCQAVINFFQKKQGKFLFLETHTKLKPAMRIYEKLGFEIAKNPKGDIYAGTDCYMVWKPSHTEPAET